MQEGKARKNDSAGVSTRGPGDHRNGAGGPGKTAQQVDRKRGSWRSRGHARTGEERGNSLGQEAKSSTSTETQQTEHQPEDKKTVIQYPTFKMSQRLDRFTHKKAIHITIKHIKRCSIPVSH